MNTSSWARSAFGVMAATLGVATGAYGAHAALAWLRYGQRDLDLRTETLNSATCREDVAPAIRTVITYLDNTNRCEVE
jgi:hypothetical protein